MIKQLFKGAVMLAAIIIVSGCPHTVKTSTVSVTNVTLDKSMLSLVIGTSGKLTATVTPENATNKAVTWSSDTPEIVSVDQDGKVTAKAVGKAVITVKTKDGGKTATCTITVSSVAVTNVTLDKSMLSLVIGTSGKLTATVTPKNATNKAVTWSSDTPEIASVDQEGKVIAKAVGKAVITAKSKDSAKKASCTVIVTESAVAVTDVTLDKPTLALAIGESSKLAATVAPESATNPAVTWSSDAPEVASVDQEGNVTAKKLGTAKITVTTQDGGKTATCTVTVRAVAVTGVTLDNPALTLEIGTSSKLTATVTPANATNKAVTWSSDAPEVASVDQEGNVTAKKLGTAKITVTTQDGGKTATCTVTVRAVAVTGVTLDNPALPLAIGESGKLTATVSPANAANKAVTWGSDAPEVASVDQEGNVTAKKLGTAKITVTTQDGGKTATCTVTVQQVMVLHLGAIKDIIINAKSEGDASISVKGCAETSLESGTGATLHAIGDTVTLQGIITELWCGENQLTALNVQDCTSLQKLDCDTNQLTVLNVQGCTNLKELKCSWNQLTSLNVQGLPELQILFCYGNQFSALNVQGLTNLRELYCISNDQLTTINAQGCTNLQRVDGYANHQLTEINVKDCINLKVLNCYSNQLTAINVQGCTNLQTLYCGENQLTVLDVQDCANLQNLGCSSNQLTALDVQGLANLQELGCGSNQLTALNVQGLANLASLGCSNNQLTALNLQGLANLRELICYANQLTAINVQGCTNLQTLYCGSNQLSELNVQGLANLASLDCGRNQLSELNVQGLADLASLHCNQNQLTALNVQGLANLKALYCNTNQLAALDVQGLANLEILNCDTNQLTALDVQGCTNLKSLNCNTNQLSELNVQSLANLASLSCDSNQLSELNVQSLANLALLSCDSNQLSELNVQGLANLQTLYCRNNQLTALNLQGLANLQTLYCDANQLTALNLQNLSELWELSCDGNQLNDLNVQGCTNLRRLYCDKNKLDQAAFIRLFTHLPYRSGSDTGEIYLYTEKTNVTEGNYKDFTEAELKIAKDKNWITYKYELYGNPSQL